MLHVCVHVHTCENGLFKRNRECLKKDSSESKVLTITINSKKLEQAFEFGKEQSPSSIVIKVHKSRYLWSIRLKVEQYCFSIFRKSDIFPRWSAIIKMIESHSQDWQQIDFSYFRHNSWKEDSYTYNIICLSCLVCCNDGITTLTLIYPHVHILEQISLYKRI